MADSLKRPLVNSEILLVSDCEDERTHVRDLLAGEYGNIPSSATAAGGLALFKKYHPVLLVLAFESVKDAEAFYLSLYRQDSNIYRAPHKTLLLCKGVESKQAYELCSSGIFNDYVADRPLFDPFRLSLSVAQALSRFHSEQGIFWLSRHLEHISSEMHRFNRFISQKITQGASQQRFNSDSFERYSHKLSKDLQKLEGGLITLLNEKVSPREAAQTVSKELDDFRQQSLQAGRRRYQSQLEQSDVWRQQMDQGRQKFEQSLPPDPARSDVVEILLIDDDDLYRETLITMLNNHDMHVMGVSDGRSALHSLLVYKPDVILLNYQMPGMDGMAVLRVLRESAHTRSIPVIMLSSDSSKQVMSECIEAGVNLFIVKPGDRKTFLSHIDQALKGR